MNICFIRIFDQCNPIDYVADKLQLVAGLSTLERQEAAREIVRARAGGELVLPLASRKEWPKHNSLHLEYLSRVVDRSSPLAPGEELSDIPDFPSYLKEDVGANLAGTIVLRRTTSHAELVYFINGAFIKEGKIYRPSCKAAEANPLDGVEVAERRAPDEAALFGAVWGPIALALAKGLASGIGSKIGSEIYDSVFGGTADVPKWFGQVYEEFVAAVHQAFEEQWMRELEALMDVVQRKIKSYNASKDRFQLQQAWGDVIELTSSLNVIGKSATANLMTGGGLHLMILQQLALTSDNPEGYEEDIRDQVTNYSDIGIANRATLLSDRLNAIGPVELSYYGPPDFRVWGYQWVDHITGASDFFPNSGCQSGEDEANASRNRHVAAVRASTEAELQPIVDVVNEWALLISNPLPPPTS